MDYLTTLNKSMSRGATTGFPSEMLLQISCANMNVRNKTKMSNDQKVQNSKEVDFIFITVIETFCNENL